MSADPMSQLFTSALGLPSPWRVEKVRFEQAVNEIHFEVVCDAQRLACPRCEGKRPPTPPVKPREL